MKIELFTDGAAIGNPGPGGYGVVLRFGNHVKEFSDGFRLTTNNRMELMAVCVGLEQLKTDAYPITVYSDSKYVVDSILKGWIFGWVQKGFKGKKNKDLWLRYLELHKKYKISVQWVKGHAGHPENERCDFLATQAAKKNPQQIDEAYEQNPDEAETLF
jgi:ribonuclease HI